jgi:hypothetical protein
MGQASVIYLKGQSQGCWLSSEQGEQRDDFEEYFAMVQHVIRHHSIRSIFWDGDPPDKNAFSEKFPELFCRLARSSPRAPEDQPGHLIDDIRAFRLFGTTAGT